MSASPKRSSCIGRLFWPILILIAAIVLWRLFFAGGGSRGMMGDAVPVRTAVAVAQNVPHFLSGLGTATPSSDVLVRSRVDGQLMALHFTEGQRVEAGDLLAEIDPRPFQAALAEAQGKLPETVREHYAVLPHHAGECIQCGACETRCPFGVEICKNMARAKEVFGY